MVGIHLDEHTKIIEYSANCFRLSFQTFNMQLVPDILDMKKNEDTTGLVSGILFGSGTLLLTLTTILTYLPRDNDYRGLLTGLGLLIGFSFVFLGIPMLVASLVTSVISVVKNHQQRVGYIVLTGNLLLGVGTIVWLFR